MKQLNIEIEDDVYWRAKMASVQAQVTLKDWVQKLIRDNTQPNPWTRRTKEPAVRP